MRYRHRVLEAQVKRYLRLFPVLGLTGPRQSGKSTLLQHVLPQYQYVTFDDHRNIDFYTTDPDGFMQVYADKVIFDEVQKVPQLFHHIKLLVDRDRQRYGKFILTGSSQFSFMQNITESLAGRIGLLSLLPFQCSETPDTLVAQAIFKGSYPELIARKYQDTDVWYSAYLDTYLHKDVRSLSNIGDLRDFQRFIQLLAANTSQQLNMATYAGDLGVAVPTIKRWLSVLEASYIIFLLPPFYRNYGKRITKSPKIYFYDTGLVAYLTGTDTFEHYSKGPMAGALFENYIVAEILKKETHKNTDAKLYYFRTNHGVEVDVIIDRKRYKEVIEIKNTMTFKPVMLDPMKEILEPKDQGYLLYNGEAFPYPKPIQVINYRDFLQE